MDYNAITAWTGLVMALVAVCGLWIESKRHRFSMGVDLLLRLEDQFTAERMYANRRKAVLAFQANNYTDAVNEIDEIIDFFEGVGFMMSQGALNKKMVWTFFSTYLFYFWHFAQEYVEQERKRDPTIWSEFIKLYRTLVKIERKACRKCGMEFKLSEKDYQQFLQEETRLRVPGALLNNRP
jgi:hypothetical protein